MATVSNYSQLLKELQKVRDRALRGTGEKTTELVKDRIDEDVYGVNPNPKEYMRTYDLRESVKPSNIKSSGNMAELKVSHDTSLINSNSDLNQHASAINGESSSHSIAEIVHNGKSGLIFGKGYWTAPRPYMFNATQEMKGGKYRDFMKDELTKQGYEVK